MARSHRQVTTILTQGGCDAVINLGMIGRALFRDRLIESTVLTDPEANPGYLDSVKQSLINFDSSYINQLVRLMEEYGKPVVGVSMITSENNQTVLDRGGWGALQGGVLSDA